MARNSLCLDDVVYKGWENEFYYVGILKMNTSLKVGRQKKSNEDPADNEFMLIFVSMDQNQQDLFLL